MEATARKTLIEYSRTLYEKRFLPGIDGNISIRVDETAVLITPSGMSKGVITENDLVLMSLDGEKLSGNKNPSCETPMHLAALRARKDINAVIHTHSPNVTSFAMVRKPIDTRCAPFAYEHLRFVGYVPYSPPGTHALHQGVDKAVSEGYIAFVLESHGSMVLGKDMHDAFVKTDLLEAYAGMLIGANVLGGAYVMTDKEIDEISGG